MRRAVLLLIGSQSGASLLRQSCSVALQNQLLFDAQEKTALNSIKLH